MSEFVPRSRSIVWLQRGWATPGLTFAQKPYSVGPVSSQNVFGRSATNENRTIDLIDLNPYFHGTCRRRGAPITFPTGLPYAPVTRKASSLVASSMVRPSTYGHGYQNALWPGAIFGSLNVSIL